ncbi:chitin binding peritrophin-A domain-containing protein [Solitalea agri]|uniref:chitin binding peritrophin-A domain-containing protein n=1 Tax=Solitalea TaxID=929509 RepID=UPI00361CC87B
MIPVFTDENEHLRYPHPTDCTKYMQCVTGVPYEQNCAQGLVYQASLDACNYCWDISKEEPCSCRE